MVTARAARACRLWRAACCVGGPAAGRGARRRRDLWRCSASSWVAVISTSLFGRWRNLGCRRSKEQRAPHLLLPNLGRRSSTTDRHTLSRGQGAKRGEKESKRHHILAPLNNDSQCQDTSSVRDHGGRLAGAACVASRVRGIGVRGRGGRAGVQQRCASASAGRAGGTWSELYSLSPPPQVSNSRALSN